MAGGPRRTCCSREIRPGRQPIAIEEVGRFALKVSAEGTGGGPGGGDNVVGVEIRIPCDLLAGGLVPVDTPGVGGLGSPQAAASVAALSMADAALFVTDAEKELTPIELEILRQARELCDTVGCVLTKMDFYPAWRTIRAVDERHFGGPMFPASAALVGERLAPTDTRECTRIVTWYRDGHTYRVVAHTKEGEARPLRFRREERALEIDLGGLRPDDVEQMTVTWPSQTLRVATLIDTPGIGSLSEQVSRRTWQLLVPEEEETPADAVLYLMRHAHASDVEFLRAFHDTEVSQPNPVNAIGVLSRADEIAVGRLDAMASAERIASQLAADPNVRRVVQTVVPVAGLLAETAVKGWRQHRS